MACTHCVLAIGCLLVLVVPVLLGRHLVAGLELALGPWKTANTGKDILYSSRRYSFVNEKGCGLPLTSNSLKG